MNIFEQAARAKLRFITARGQIAVEQLWDLPLSDNCGFNLDEVAKKVKRELDQLAEESFVEKSASTERAELELRLELVKHVIADKLEVQRRREQAAVNNERKQVLLQALAQKNQEAIAGLSKEDLEAELAKLS